MTSSDCIQFWERVRERLVGIEKRDEEIYSLSREKECYDYTVEKRKFQKRLQFLFGIKTKKLSF